jgi:nucleotide-binding universal stress UspA family protein
MYQRILVPVDGSPTSELGLQEAIKLSRLTQARLRLLHVVDVVSLYSIAGDGLHVFPADLVTPLRQQGEELLRRCAATVEAAGSVADTALLENTQGRVADLVVDEAKRWQADLIVLGTHGRRGMRRALLGSDAEQVARLALVPVLLVRGKASASPVQP